MFERITTGRDHCMLCGSWGPVAYLPVKVMPGEVDVAVCERCIRASVKAADLLKLMRDAKDPKRKRTPNKTRKPASEAPRSTEPYRGPSKHEVGSLVPPAEERTA